ncbi:mRNA 3'-end-processing protein RNA14 [Mycena sanguinolenta]|uniref:mRNA 3'-end-processing protein RNA14 n=1 Tax=Mycena sanguinolenta TaxID=230812 RepID=A0A8H7CPF7_9AGAR|nr:mRNA 3'-end-processing protein RNA14 [Mycena sanguinolenta]
MTEPLRVETGSDTIPPLSDYDVLMARLKDSPHDPERWKRLIDVAESSGDIPRIRKAYDALLTQYPNTASAQTAYLKHLLDQSTYNDAEELLNKFLRTSPAVELWKFYLDYVRHLNNGPSMRDTMRKAYDFALNHVGQDRDSGPIWAKYIQFLSAGEPCDTSGTQQKMAALRKAYHRAVQMPLKNVEQLWTQLEAFEMGLNKITAKKFMSELSPAHRKARSVLCQLNRHLQRLENTNDKGIFLPAPATFSAKERELIQRWKAYLKWEEGDPLEIEEKDRATFISRVENAYRKAVIRMRLRPTLWTTSVGKNGDALSILKAGLEANPESFVLTYAYAEQLEKAELKKDRRDFSAVHSVYERFFSVLRENLSRLTALAALPAVSVDEAKKENGSQETISPAYGPNKHYQDELSEGKKLYSNVWINYMRFVRRAQGQTTCREAFSKACKDEYVGWEVYDAAAMTEYRCNLEDGRLVSSCIFENGMKRFGTDVAYVLAHLNFLLTINDENSASHLSTLMRARFFERAVPTFTPEEAKPLWDRWSRSQYQYDDLEAVLELERRVAQIYPNDVPLKRFAQRHMYHSIDAIANNDLGFTKTRELVMANGPQPGGANPPFAANANISGNAHTNGSGNTSSQNPNKRPLPPADRKPHEYKRPRTDERARDRRRYSPPPPAPRRDPEKPVPLPAVLNWFVTQLPPRETFDGALHSGC